MNLAAPQIYPPGRALPLLGSIAAAALGGFIISQPFVAATLKIGGVAAAVGFVEIERRRRYIESGQLHLDSIALEQAKLDLQLQQIEDRRVEIEEWVAEELLRKDQECEAKLLELSQANAEELAAIEAEREEIKEKWAQFYQSSDELNARQQILNAQLQKWELEKTVLRQELENELFEARKELIVAQTNLQARENEFILENTTNEDRIRSTIAVERQAIILEKDSLIQELEDTQKAILIEKKQAQDEYNQRFAEISAAYSELENEKRAKEDQIAELVEMQEARLEFARQEIIATTEQEKLAYIHSVQDFIDNQKRIIGSLQARIEELEELPTFGAEAAYAGSVGNGALAVLREFGLEVFPHDVRVLPWDSATKPAMLIWLRVGAKTRPESIYGCRDAIIARIKVKPVEITLDDHGFIVIGVGDVREAVDFSTGTESSAKDKGGKKIYPIKEPSTKLVTQTLGYGNFYLIAGPPGSGKSALINNVLGFSASHFGKRIRNRIIDKKFPDPKTRWRLRGKEITPEFVLMYPRPGLEGFGLCSDGLHEMYATAMSRRDRRLMNIKNGNPLDRFHKEQWILDEVPAMVATDKSYKATVKACGANTVREGRGMDMRAFFIGQSYLCSDYGLNTPDLQNMTRIYLGADYALEAILRKQVVLSPEKKREIVGEIYARKALAAEQIERGELVNDNPPAKFFALVAGEGEVFLMSLPAPGEWEDLPVMCDEDDDSLAIVPDEELTPISHGEILDQIERAMLEEGVEPPEDTKTEPAPVRPEPVEVEPRMIDTSKMPPLLAAIAEWVLDPEYPERQGINHAFSDLYTVYTIKKAAHDWLRSNKSSMSKAKVIRAACFQLVRDWKLGEMVKDGRVEKFRIG